MQEKIFLDNFLKHDCPVTEKNAPIKDYSVYLEPQKDDQAKKVGDKVVQEMADNFIADFEKNEAYNKVHGGNPDQMCHVSTFYKLNGKIYMTYYANEDNENEDPKFQIARLAYCDENHPEDMKILTVSKVGDVIGGRSTVMVYDTIMMYDGGDIFYILWTASLDGEYYRLYRTFNMKTEEFGEIGINRLKIGDFLTDFSVHGIQTGFEKNKLPRKEMFSDIGIMQKLSYRMENGKKVYYSGAYSGFLTFIIKSTDFITWEFVAEPDFINYSEWENATYVLNDKVYYFVRQLECNQGFLTVYDLKTKTWEKPTLISDCQSRADFFYYKNDLYLMNAPKSRECIAVTKIDTKDISKSKVIFFADLKSSIFYPFTQVYGDDLYISYTIARKHIRLTKINLKHYL